MRWLASLGLVLPACQLVLPYEDDPTRIESVAGRYSTLIVNGDTNPCELPSYRPGESGTADIDITGTGSNLALVTTGLLGIALEQEYGNSTILGTLDEAHVSFQITNQMPKERSGCVAFPRLRIEGDVETATVIAGELFHELMAGDSAACTRFAGCQTVQTFTATKLP